MKYLLPYTFVFTLLFLSITQGQSLGTTIEVKSDAQLDLPTQAVGKSEAQQKNTIKVEEKDTKETEQQEKSETKGTSVSESHRSTVANAVQKLLDESNKNKKIGPQISAIAQQQGDTQASIDKNVARLEMRSKLRTLLIGSGYKTIGAIRSDLVKSKASIEQLKAVIAQTTDVTLKVKLMAEVSVLEQEQVKIETFIKQQESVFSLFGWTRKIFNK